MNIYDPTKAQGHIKYGLRPAHGRSTLVIICPFCQEHVTAFVWSLHGGGKKCTCGALHMWRTTVPLRNQILNKDEQKQQNPAGEHTRTEHPITLDRQGKNR